MSSSIICSHTMDNEESKTCQGEKLASAVDDTLDEYLIALQHKNRLIKRLKVKDPREIELERLEQGFSIYLNGANAEASRKQLKGYNHKPVSSQSPWGTPRAAGRGIVLKCSVIFKMSVEAPTS